MSVQQSIESGAPLHDDPFWIIGLCAQWCGVCREFEPVFGEMRQRFPHVRFAWLDVEDEQVAEALGEQDIDTFPFIIAGSSSQVVFQGPVLPQESVLERLIVAWAASARPEATSCASESQPQNVLVRLLAAMEGMPQRFEPR